MGKITIPETAAFPAVADLVVIGGGIVGCATAFWATKVGLDTILVEKREALCTLTTPNSAEAVRAQFGDVDNVEMMMASLDMFEHFAEVIGIPDYDIAFHQQGYVFSTTKEDGPQVLQARVRQQNSWGLSDVEYLDGDEARRRFPYLAPEVTAATFRQRDGWLSTHEVTYGFAKGSTARIFLETEATNLTLDGQGIAGVQTRRGPIHTRAVVIAAGPYSGRVAEWAGVHLPIVIMRRQKAVIHSPLVPQDGAMTIDLDTGAYWHPEPGGALLGWAEAVEEKPAEPSDHVPADWDFPAISLEGCIRLAPFWERIGETLRGEDVHASAGQYTITPDSKPILGPLVEVPGLYFNGGFSGHGVMAAPDASRRVVDMIVGRQRPEDNPFCRERFEEGRTQQEEHMVI